MYNFISKDLTYSVNNRCVYSLLKKTRVVDSQLDTTHVWQDTSITIEGTELVPLSSTAVLENISEKLFFDSKNVFKIYCKNILIQDFLPLDYSLEMVLRKTPQGQSLDLFTGKYILLKAPDAVKIDQWLYVEKGRI